MAERQNGGVTDRYGIPVTELADRTDDNAFVPMLHNHLLDGMSEVDITARLRKLGYSGFEAKAIIASSKQFIEKELKIDLAARIAAKEGPVGLAMRLARIAIENAKALRDSAITAPIEYRGYTLDADEASVNVLKRYILGNVTADSWVTRSNAQIRPWTMDDQKEVVALLSQRESNIVAAYQTWREELNAMAEAGNVAAVRTAEFVLDTE